MVHLETYTLLYSASFLLASIMIVQLLIADFIGIRNKHLPGAPVKADHGNPLFRASRVVANTNESVSIFILLSALCVLVAAPAQITGIAAWVYVSARLIYALCYYANLKLMRSILFGISVLALIALLVIGLLAWR